MKVMYLRKQGHPFGVLVWNTAVIGWSLCDDVHPNLVEKDVMVGAWREVKVHVKRMGKPDHFSKLKGRELAFLQAAGGYTLDDAVCFALEPSEPWQWKQRAVKDAIRRVTFPILAARQGLRAGMRSLPF